MFEARSNLVKDKNDDLLPNPYILNMWKNSSQLLNVYVVSDVRQIEIHIAETLVPVPSRL
jgi:hypothetical protein